VPQPFAGPATLFNGTSTTRWAGQQIGPGDFFTTANAILVFSWRRFGLHSANIVAGCALLAKRANRLWKAYRTI
jgi:hypothetical protein